MTDVKPAGRHRRQPNQFTLPPRAYATTAAAFLLGILVLGSAAVITTPNQPAQAAPVIELDPADLPPADPGAGRPTVLVPVEPSPTPEPTPSQSPQPWSALPNRGEGIIALVARLCGPGADWPAVAVDNGIVGPRWVVPEGLPLVVRCQPLLTPVPVASDDTTANGDGTTTPPGSFAPASDGWANPVPGVCISSGFQTAARPGHNGYDLAAGHGVPIHAVAPGTISTGWEEGGAGNYLVVDHGGWWTVYMHLSGFERTSGQVAADEVIGYVGNTGDSRGPHLHLEVHVGSLWNNRVDPGPYLAEHGISWVWC